MQNELKACNCSCPLPFCYQTFFLGIPIATTIMCVWCRVKITRLTKTSAIKAWNGYFEKRNNNAE